MIPDPGDLVESISYLGARPGRVGVCAAAECEHAVQRPAAAVGPGGGGVGLRRLPGPTQHLPGRGHRPAGHRIPGHCSVSDLDSFRCLDPDPHSICGFGYGSSVISLNFLIIIL